jgi:hypothetical protein
MDLVLAAAKPWHFWIAPAVLGLTVLLIIATIVGYLVKVVSPKYPKS